MLLEYKRFISFSASLVTFSLALLFYFSQIFSLFASYTKSSVSSLSIKYSGFFYWPAAHRMARRPNMIPSSGPRLMQVRAMRRAGA